MALNPVPDDVYVIATAEGRDIPLAAVRPLGFYTLTADYALNLPEDVNLISFWSNVDCKILFSGAILNGNFQGPGFYALANVAYELIVPKEIAVHFQSTGGRAVINLLQKWQQMTNLGTYVVS